MEMAFCVPVQQQTTAAQPHFGVIDAKVISLVGVGLPSVALTSWGARHYWLRA